MASRRKYPTLKPPPKGFKFLPVCGSCSSVSVSEDGSTVLKHAVQYHDGPEVDRNARHRIEDSVAFLAREKAIYQHLGPHSDLLRLIEVRDDGLLFPYMRNGSLRAYLQATPEVSTEQRLRWMDTAADVLAWVNSRHVLVGDISARNFLVTDDCSIVLCDFSGSGLGDLECLVGPEVNYDKRDANGQSPPASLATEAFALGCLIYEIATGKAPYADLEIEQVMATMGKEYPSTDHVLCGHVISSCWAGEYASCEEVLAALKEHKAAEATRTE